ncbi:TetR/AcrR family transcriptional regulator [Populibacterium corticicola]|uniref:TetR/AcrR family transcriptional regulator n=1 Tax=Populibacterium corticicola TaxID=1812826 RepID=A0ABW5XEE0_9MICO
MDTSDKRERILDATLDLVAQSGLTGATYRTIAVESGVPLGSMTYYFSSREELLFAAFQRFTHISFARMKEAAAPNDRNLVDSLTQLILTETTSERLRDRILLAELYVLSYREQRYAELTREWMKRAHEVIAEANPLVSPRALDAAQEGLTIQRHFMPEEVTEELIFATLNKIATVP